MYVELMHATDFSARNFSNLSTWNFSLICQEKCNILHIALSIWHSTDYRK